MQRSISNATAPAEASKLQREINLEFDMWLLMVEAMGALLLLVFIVWWTMYSGRTPDPAPEAVELGERKAPPASTLE